MALISSFYLEEVCLGVPNSLLFIVSSSSLPSEWSWDWIWDTSTHLLPSWISGQGPQIKILTLSSTTLFRRSTFLSRNPTPSVSCQQEVASQSWFCQYIVLAVFPKGVRLTQPLQQFACWAVRMLTFSSWSPSIKLCRIVSVLETPHCLLLG